jgi:hypothetical protein
MPDPTEADHDRFLSQATASGEVWGLYGKGGWAVTESEDDPDRVVYPFWSERADAAAHCSGDWSHFKPKAITLDDLLERWLPGMSGDGVLVGTNWDADLSGAEWEPLELAEQLYAANSD